MCPPVHYRRTWARQGPPTRAGPTCWPSAAVRHAFIPETAQHVGILLSSRRAAFAGGEPSPATPATGASPRNLGRRTSRLIRIRRTTAMPHRCASHVGPFPGRLEAFQKHAGMRAAVVHPAALPNCGCGFRPMNPALFRATCGACDTEVVRSLQTKGRWRFARHRVPRVHRSSACRAAQGTSCEPRGVTCPRDAPD